MLDENLKAQLEAALAHLKSELVLTASLDESVASRETRSLLEEIAAASPKIKVVESRDEARTPSFAIHRPGEAPRVRFAGVPLGHEFTSLVLALLHVSGHPPRVSDEELARAEKLEGTYRFETFFSQSCQNCPDVVQALNVLAARNPNVTHVAIDGAAFADEAEERGVMSVPTVFLDGEPFATGRMELGEILDKLDTAGNKARAEALEKAPPFDVLIVGGGPAGGAAAIYAARKGLRTGIVTERFGGQVLDTMAIENFISVPETEGPKWVENLKAHVRAYPVEIIERERASRLVPGELPAVELESGATLRAKSVILAPGARWRNMNVPGEEQYRTRGVTYCPHCDGPLFKGKRVAVIGGGNSGVEAAIDLAGVTAHVTLLEFLDELKADAVLVRKLRSLPNVDVITSARTTEVIGDGARVTGLRYEDRKTGELHELPVQGVFVQIGLVPNTEWLHGAVELTGRGEIVVGEKQETSVPGVFAAGDATTVPFKQIIVAAGDGAKAALGAFEHLIRTSAPSA
ncbi:MAG: alkyl hydroperoxide reductase subunit F [Myxococcales bacterium]|nr:alkyl hydroperoxide reductase subunit F [Myxococcales bacterium]